MMLYNICTMKKYVKDGENKVSWYKVGILKITEAGRKYIKLYQHPDTEFFVFSNTEKPQEASA